MSVDNRNNQMWTSRKRALFFFPFDWWPVWGFMNPVVRRHLKAQWTITDNPITSQCTRTPDTPNLACISYRLWKGDIYSGQDFLSLSLSLSPLLCFITTGVRFACGVDVGSVGVCCGGSGGWWWSKANKNILWEIGLSSQTLIGPTILTHIVCSEYFYKIAIPTNSSIVCTDQTKHQNALCKQKCRKRCSKQ